MSVQWKSRRLAPRALKVLERHKGSSPAVAVFEAPLGTAARAFVAAYTEAGAYKARWRVEMDEGRGSMLALKKEIDVWKPHVARERPGFDLAGIGDKPTVPEDLIEDAQALADELREVRGADGATVAWAAAAATSITEKASRAENETDEAAAADARYSSLLSQVREAQAVFDAELSRFRATLRSLLGSSHPDFQKLRVSRASSRDGDDDPTGPAPSDPVTPAPTPPRV
ncbi:hypothetical protein [Sandaracinus amylolyticus]|uniref:Uncharacterized protein n=1 Tax=Sandaracinus amylolyticus TaxID=927083 RepID=A0A0F6W7M2_9BACT|nr:hypothetical protein [Sandaracinus amylolyticus]AKF09340.1 hypothetical protein DB32_006489 [Sandaracinus amylolyticus]